MRSSYFIAGIAGVCALSLAALAQMTNPGPEGTNRPVVYPNTAQRPIPLGETNRTSQVGRNTNLPSAYQDGISNLNDTIGTNSPNHGYAHPTLTNRPNPNLQMP